MIYIIQKRKLLIGFCSLFEMLRVHKAMDLLGKHVYTSDGDYFGQIDEVNLVDNKIDGWKIRVGGGFISVLGGARGVIIPHSFVKAIGDVFIVNKASLPTKHDSTEPLDVGSEGAATESISKF